jgi:hypothetical protein
MGGALLHFSIIEYNIQLQKQFKKDNSSESAPKQIAAKRLHYCLHYFTYGVANPMKLPSL